jgi:hypothetical protein
LIANEKVFEAIALIRPNGATSCNRDFTYWLIRFQEWIYFTDLTSQFHKAPIGSSATGISMCIEFVSGDMTFIGSVTNVGYVP